MNTYTLLADVVVLLHFAYVLFVILGQLAILCGYFANWNWVRNKWFRLIHFSMIAIVVVESLLSITCPLTILEDYLRLEGGQSVSGSSFMGRCAHDLLFINLEPTQFTLLYVAFGTLVLLSFIIVPILWRKPRQDSRSHQHEQQKL
ncbi:MAG: DUF2784 domain-containing protein [Planctomycetota bacterium]